ncbi:MAG: hypothetical protein IJL06_00780 [Kiritimatiellae bacterium]|nr:hypothetical protein [Kiritimatiellia bacterium]
MSRRPRRRHVSAAALRRADRWREEARLNAALRRHAWAEYYWETGPNGPWGMAFSTYLPLAAVFAETPNATPGALQTVVLPFLSKAASSFFREVRLRAYRARAGVDRAFARECAQRLRDARDSGRIEYLRVLRALAAERVRREDAREREALSRRPCSAALRAKARARRDLAWQDWFGTLEKAVAGCGTPPRDPGMPNLSDRPRRKGAPIRRLCVFSAKPAPTGDEVREQFEKARGRGKVEEKIKLGSMLLDAEATTDSSLIRDCDGEIVGRNGGLRGWIFDNCPDLLPHYAALTGYRRLAWETRDAADLFDPVPAELLLASDPEVEKKVRPAQRERLPGARKRLRELLAAPESATVAGFLRRLRAERDERERAGRNRRRLA